MCPSIKSAGRRFAFLHTVLRGEFPCFTGTIKALRLPAARSTALRYLRLVVPQRSLVAFAPEWLKRRQAGHEIDVTCLHVGKARVLHLPGELFVEYQLAAKALRPDLQVAQAAYGDYGPGYIGTAAAYPEGGYETSPRASNVAPEVEEVLMIAVKKLLSK